MSFKSEKNAHFLLDPAKVKSESGTLVFADFSSMHNFASRTGVGGGVQIVQQSPPSASEVTSIPFISNLGGLPGTTPHKPSGSKICRWVQNDGTVCGKAFSKLDSLRRHVNELHKSIRPYACSLCEKSYGRRDYLDRHMRTHNKKKNLNALDQWGPNSGVLMQGDEAPPPPKVRSSFHLFFVLVTTSHERIYIM